MPSRGLLVRIQPAGRNTDCSSTRRAAAKNTPRSLSRHYGRVTQRPECYPYKVEVVGSNPTVPNSETSKRLTIQSRRVEKSTLLLQAEIDSLGVADDKATRTCL